MYDLIKPPASRRAVDRRHAAELDRLDRQADLAEARVAGVNRVSQRALMELTMTGLIRKQAEQICPDNAEVYAMVVAAAGVGSVQAINSVSTRRY